MATKNTSKVAIVDTTGYLSLDKIDRIAAAILFQMNEHVKPVWGIGAESIKGFSNISSVPDDYWIASIVDTIPQGDEFNGIHGFIGEGSQRMPYAKIKYNLFISDDHFTKVISEEIIETLVDPFAENKRIGKDPEFEQAPNVNYLVEIGDPTQSIDIGYYIKDVFVTNFIFPSFFNLVHIDGTKYDYLGMIQRPFQLLEGGDQVFERAGQWFSALKVKGKMYFIKQGESLPDSATNNTAIYIILGVLYSLLFLGFYILNKRKKNGSNT